MIASLTEGMYKPSSRIDKYCGHILLIGFFLITGGFYFFKDYGGVARSFYVLFMLPTIICLPYCFDKKFFFSKEMLIFFVPIAYLALSTLWVSEEYKSEARSVLYWAKPSLFLLFLFVGIKIILERYRNVEEYLFKFLVVVALITAIISLYQYIPEAYSKNHWPRMAGMSLRGDINVTAALYGMAVVFSVYGLLVWNKRWAFMIICAILFSISIVLLSRSKVPLFYLIVSFIAFVGISFKGKGFSLAKLIIIIALLSVAIGFYAYFGRVPFIERLNSYSVRFELWLNAIEQMKGVWWFGHGVGSDINLIYSGREYASHSHNILIDTLRYGGLLGLILVLAQVIAVVFSGFWLAKKKVSYLLVLCWYVLGILFLLTNGQQLLVKPHHIWFYYWLPAALLLSICYLEKRTQAFAK